MFTLDPYASTTLNTAAAFYDCWECDDSCPPPPWKEPIITTY